MTDFVLVETNRTQTILVSAPGPQGPPGDPEVLFHSVNAWTRQQYHPLSVLSVGVDNHVAWDWDTQPEAVVTLSGSGTYYLDMPTNRQPGAKSLRIYQSGGTGAISFAAGYILDASLNSLTLTNGTFADLYFKDDGEHIIVFGAEYTIP